jgi:hypothetical protein
MILFLVLAFSTVATAQPAASDPTATPMPAEVAQPVEGPAVQLQLQLTAEQQQQLDQGEIPIGGWLTGGVLSTFLGFGIGQAIQGRYKSRGWMFTVGDSVAVTVALYGAARCCQPAGHTEEYLVLGGVAALIGLRIWQTLDAWLVPPAHNRKVRALRTKLGLAPPSYGLYLAPPQSSASGGVAGLSLSF